MCYMHTFRHIGLEAYIFKPVVYNGFSPYRVRNDDAIRGTLNVKSAALQNSTDFFSNMCKTYWKSKGHNMFQFHINYLKRELLQWYSTKNCNIEFIWQNQIILAKEKTSFTFGLYQRGRIKCSNSLACSKHSHA